MKLTTKRKEQISSVLIICLGNILNAFSARVFLLPADLVAGGTTGIGPVSYTHLDVYKRQSLDFLYLGNDDKAFRIDLMNIFFKLDEFTVGDDGEYHIQLLVQIATLNWNDGCTCLLYTS